MKYLFFFLLFATGTSFAQTIFPLYCKGGYEYGISRPDIYVRFERATVAAGYQDPGRNLPPGTCAWQDRPMNENEPHYIKLSDMMWAEPQTALIREFFLTGTTHLNCVIRVSVRATSAQWLEMNKQYPHMEMKCYPE